MWVFQIELDIEDIRLILKSLKLHKDKWSGGDPEEQIQLNDLILEFTRMQLDHMLDEDQS